MWVFWTDVYSIITDPNLHYTNPELWTHIVDDTKPCMTFHAKTLGILVVKYKLNYAG